MPGLDFSGPWVSVFTIIVKVIEYKRKKIIDESRKCHDYNHFVLIPFHFVIKLFVFRSDLASSDGFFHVRFRLAKKNVNHTNPLSVFYNMIGTLTAN